MIRTRKRMTLCLILTVLNVAFIWGNSLMPREMSSAFSQFVGNILNILFPGPDIPPTGEGHGLLRKIAHFTEFCCLGVLLCWGVRMLRQKKWEGFVYPIGMGALVAITDETIQHFVPGRGPGVRDVLIDTSGVVLGVLLLAGIHAIRIRKGDE